MTIQLGPPDHDPTEIRPLDIVSFSKNPSVRIVRYANDCRSGYRGYANLTETFRHMTYGQILQVRSRFGKEPPQLKPSARRAGIQIKIESRPPVDDLLVTCVGRVESKSKSKSKSKPKVLPEPKAKSTIPQPQPSGPRTRCFKDWNRTRVDIFS